MRWTKYDRANEREKDSLLEGVKKLMFDISDQNTKNIETVVSLFKTDKTDRVKDVAETRGDATGAYTNLYKIVKPAKVPSWTKGLSLEIYTKQVNT